VSEKIKVSLEKKKNLEEALVGHYVVNMAKKKLKLRLLGKVVIREILLGSYPLVGRHVVKHG